MVVFNEEIMVIEQGTVSKVCGEESAAFIDSRLSNHQTKQCSVDQICSIGIVQRLRCDLSLPEPVILFSISCALAVLAPAKYPTPLVGKEGELRSLFISKAASLMIGTKLSNKHLSEVVERWYRGSLRLSKRFLYGDTLDTY